MPVPPPAPVPFRSVDELLAGLRGASYFADPALGTAIFLGLKLGRPLLLEGEAGVGKTEVAKALAAVLERRLIRLQCYEGLDLASAAYEWDYGRQLLAIRLAEAEAKEGGHRFDERRVERRIFSREFLLERPLLAALTPADGDAPVLLIDEIDRADEEFEAFLLEVLSEFQISVPELGTIQAPVAPVVIVTSNRTREIHDALRRRCLYHWLDFPPFEKELEIVRAKVPAAGEALARQVVRFVEALRAEDLYKRPGVAETLDWAAGLVALDRERLAPEAVEATLGLLLKVQDDLEAVRGRVVERAVARSLEEGVGAGVP